MDVASSERETSKFINELNELKTKKQVALHRLHDLNFASKLVNVLQRLCGEEYFSVGLKEVDGSTKKAVVQQTMKIKSLLQFMEPLLHIFTLDMRLAEEFGREGGHIIIKSLMKWEPIRMGSSGLDLPDEVLDEMDYMKDVVFHLASTSAKFPISFSPLTEEEKSQRLPLVFNVGCDIDSDSRKQILIHQVQERQGNQDDVGFVMWPSAVLLSNYISKNRSKFCGGRKVLELGAGCGLAGLTAAYYGANVILTDFNDKVNENTNQNIELNNLQDLASCSKLDFYHQTSDCHGWLDANTQQIRDQVDIIIGADIICKHDDAIAVANTCSAALKEDKGTAYIICGTSAHRFGIDSFEKACLNVGLNVLQVEYLNSYRCTSLVSNGSFTATNCDDDDCNALLLLNEELHQTAGYVEEMNMIFFKLSK